MGWFRCNVNLTRSKLTPYRQIAALGCVGFAGVMIHEGAQAFCGISVERVIRYDKVLDAVKAEGAKALTQVALGREHPAFGEIPDRNGPDAALAALARAVRVGQLHDPLFADRIADWPCVFWRASGVAKGKVGRIDKLSRLGGGHGGLDLCPHFAGGGGQSRIIEAFGK